MPSSDMTGKPVIKKFIEDHPDIKVIVDLGPGSATYPKVCGEDSDRPIEGLVWKAVEIWGPYIERFNLNKYYSEIRIGDIRYMELPDGDCCIAGDVLEHLPREDFIKTFKKIDKQFKYVIVSVPINLLSSDVFEGNPFESHLSYWSIEELDGVFGENYEKVIADPCVLFFKK